MGEGAAAALKDLAAQLAAKLRDQAETGREAWSQLHGKLAEIAAASTGHDPRSAVQALLKLARDASSSPSLMRTLEESVNPYVLKYVVYLVAHELNMTPLGDSEPVHMVDRGKKFCDKNVDLIIKGLTEFSAPDASYTVVSIIGAQSTGKSYLLNCLFGTRFPVMDAKRGWSQTTRGIMMSRCIGPSLLLLDVEGFDGRENGQDTLFEKQAALFALTVSSLMIVNMPIGDISREEGGGTTLFRTIFQERAKIQEGGLTKILVVLRDYSETPLEILRSDVRKRMRMIWESVDTESREFNDYIEVDVFGMPHKESPEFPKEVTVLRGLLSKNISAKVPSSSFTASSKIIWENVKKNKKLDIPSHQLLISNLFCGQLVEEILNSLDSLKDYMLLKAELSKDEPSPSYFKKASDAVLESIKTRYDLETKMYDRETSTKLRKDMVEKLYKILAEYSRKLIWKMKERASDDFKVKLIGENIQSMKEAEADSYGIRIVESWVAKFISSSEDLKEFDSDYTLRMYGDLKKQLQSDIQVHIIKIKEERARKENERIGRASFVLQATDTAMHLGDLAVGAFNIFSGAHGNGSG